MTRVIDEFSLPANSSVISDKMVMIGTAQNRSENVFRLIKVLDSKDNELHLLTNRFDSSADEIAELYKSHWAIELFFKWIKQHLNIKKFYGQSEQAVHNQVYIAMIVYCLNVLAQLSSKSKRTYLQISRFFKHHYGNLHTLGNVKSKERAFHKAFYVSVAQAKDYSKKKWMFTTSVKVSLFFF